MRPSVVCGAGCGHPGPVAMSVTHVETLETGEALVVCDAGARGRC